MRTNALNVRSNFLFVHVSGLSDFISPGLIEDNLIKVAFSNWLILNGRLVVSFNFVTTRNGERLVCWLSVVNGGNSVIFEHGIAGARGVAVKVAMLLNLIAFDCLDSLNSLL